jgi:hypothetical protein
MLLLNGNIKVTGYKITALFHVLTQHNIIFLVIVFSHVLNEIRQDDPFFIFFEFEHNIKVL